MHEIFANQRVVRIELLGRSVQAVSVFGNGQADDPYLRPIDNIQQVRAELAREHHIGE